ncbi:MAG: SDR family oxidoreductase [Actinomycetota bacterium]
MRLDDAGVVVTGAASGIGAALARRFAAEGARLVLVDRQAEPLAALGAELGAVTAVCDVVDPEAVGALVAEADETLGPIDCFCSNAGVLVPGGVEVTPEDWDRSFAVNVTAHISVARALVPRMLERGGGHLLQTVSAAGLLTQIGSAPYSVTKHAALAFAEWLSITYGDRGLRVSVLAPQAVRTAMTEGIDGGGVAGVDGMLEPDAVAAAAVAGLAEDAFLILPHPEVAEYFRRKADDYERWLRGMRRLQSRFPGGTG